MVNRLRTSLATSNGLCALASSRRIRRFTLALPLLISISNSAKRSAPSASSFLILKVFWEATGFIRWRGKRLPPSLSKMGRAVAQLGCAIA